MKKILLSLFVSLIGFVGFSNGIDFEIDSFITTGTFTVPTITANYGFTSVYDTNNTNFKNYCVYIDNVSSYGDIIVRYDSSATRTASSTIQGGFLLESAFSSSFSDYFNLFCTNGTRRYYGFSYPKASAGITFDYYIFDSSQLGSKINELEGKLNLCESDLGECLNSTCISESTYNACVSDLSSCNSLLSGYSNSLDICSSNYNNCSTSLNSCLQSNCPDSENPLDFNSTVYIYRNNSYYSISGTKNIYLNLPSYIGYNYGYSNGNDLDINVSVSQDTGYIEGVLNVQNYKPSSEDFTNVVGLLAPYSKYLVFLLFVFIIWAWIKKSFKSKKL